MAPRGGITLTVTFGPASTPVFASAVAYAGTHAEKLEKVGSKTYRASFVLGTDPDIYGRSMDLVHMVYGWRATLIEVDGSPEMVRMARGHAVLRPGVAPKIGPVRGALPERPAPQVSRVPAVRPGVGS